MSERAIGESVGLIDFFGDSKGSRMQRDGASFVVSLQDFYSFGEIEDAVKPNGYEVDKTRWNQIKIAFVIPTDRTKDWCLSIYYKQQDGKGNFMPYVLDKDVQRFKEVFGREVQQ